MPHKSTVIDGIYKGTHRFTRTYIIFSILILLWSYIYIYIYISYHRPAATSVGLCLVRDSSSVFLERYILLTHYNDVIVRAMACQITSLTIVYSTVYSGTDERKHQSTASLDFVRGIHRWPVNSPHKGPVSRRMFPLDDAIMELTFSSRYITMTS